MLFHSRIETKVNIATEDQNIDIVEDENDDEDEEYDPIPIDNCDGKMMFIYQSPDMKKLYRRYAKTLILLDATYKTSKYALPLFFLVVQTNVNYQIAAFFVIQEETSEMITEALTRIKGKLQLIYIYIYI